MTFMSNKNKRKYDFHVVRGLEETLESTVARIFLIFILTVIYEFVFENDVLTR